MTSGWGDTVIYGPAAPRPTQWLEGQSVVVCDTGPVPAGVYTCALVCEHYDGPALTSENTTILWEIQVAVGRTTVTYDIDAVGSQVICVPAQRIRVAAKGDKMFWHDAPYVVNPATWRLSALIAPGNAGGAVSPAIRSFEFNVEILSSRSRRMPAGARSWRMAGPETGVSNNPFVSTTEVSIPGALERWRGDRLSAAHNSDSWIPIPADSYRMMTISNGSTSTVISGHLMFAFDL